MPSASVERSARRRTWIKFCGCTSWDDVAASIGAGADAVGFIFAPSPRRIAWEAAWEIARKLSSAVAAVGVFVDPSARDVDAARSLFSEMTVQLCGTETADLVARYGDRAIKAIGVGEATTTNDLDQACSAYDRALILFDTKDARVAGGTGRTFDWATVAPISRRRSVIVAGGLTPENVGDCVRAVRPFGVDVRSGVETHGRKDPAKMRAFVRAVRAADEA